jgi:SM-20-related protein
LIKYVGGYLKSSCTLTRRTDLEQLTQSFHRNGYVLVPNVLPIEFAAAVLDRARSWTEWNLVTRIGDAHKAFNARAMTELPTDKFEAFFALVHAQARSGFQYLYERYPLDDRARMGLLTDPILFQALQSVRSTAFIALLRQITQIGDLEETDLQLSRYRSGHFLTAHDDSHAPGLRRAAFVINLTQNWRSDFGGLLQFLDADGHIERAFTPTFNAMALFRVPKAHAVSAVPAFVDKPRFALTGWGSATVASIRASYKTPSL